MTRSTLNHVREWVADSELREWRPRNEHLCPYSTPVSSGPILRGEGECMPHPVYSLLETTVHRSWSVGSLLVILTLLKAVRNCATYQIDPLGMVPFEANFCGQFNAFIWGISSSELVHFINLLWTDTDKSKTCDDFLNRLNRHNVNDSEEYLNRVPTRPGKPGKPGKMRVHLENLEISWNFEKFNKYGKMTWNLEKLGGY